jgi:hypothetical protein
LPVQKKKWMHLIDILETKVKFNDVHFGYKISQNC